MYLDRQTAKISSGIVSKYESLTGKHVLPDKDLLVRQRLFVRQRIEKTISVGEKHDESFTKILSHTEKGEPVKIKEEGSLTTTNQT